MANAMEVFQKEMADLQDQMNRLFRDKFSTVVKAWMREEKVDAVSWNQYTPSFNDGEPCTFRIGGEAAYSFDPDVYLAREREWREEASAKNATRWDKQRLQEAAPIKNIEKGVALWKSLIAESSAADSEEGEAARKYRAYCIAIEESDPRSSQLDSENGWLLRGGDMGEDHPLCVSSPNFLYSVKDHLEAMFGNGIQIIAVIDKNDNLIFQTSDYDCGY